MTDDNNRLFRLTHGSIGIHDSSLLSGHRSAFQIAKLEARRMLGCINEMDLVKIGFHVYAHKYDKKDKTHFFKWATNKHKPTSEYLKSLKKEKWTLFLSID